MASLKSMIQGGRVRGHYADYTKGTGLFGNPKLRAVFWIPEHRAGNEELGTVVSSYTVK